MNRRIILLTATVLAVTGCFFMQGCIQQHAPAFPEIASIQADTTVLLKPEVETSPDCRISIDFMYLKPASPTDSVSEAVNRIQKKSSEILRRRSAQRSQARRYPCLV